MSFDLKAFGNKLTRSRVQLDLTQEEVASRIGVDISRLKLLENGSQEPTGDEVLILSDFYLQDYNFFISNEQKSASEQVDILFRKLGQDISKQDRWAIKEFIFLCECEEFILKGIGYERKQFSFKTNTILHKTQGFEGAKELRKFLGFQDDTIIPDIYSSLRKIGIHIFRRRLENSKISGLFLNHPQAGKCVLVNYDEDVFRQNFTTGHETGHAIFDAEELVNISSSNDDKRDFREVRANSFASSFLVPKGLSDRFNKLVWNDKLILETSIKLKVNPIVLAISLSQSKIISRELYNQFKNLKIPKNEKLDSELSGVSPKIYEAKKRCLELGLSTFYIKKCHEAYTQGLVSANRMAEMLLTDSARLPEILALFNLRLNNEY